jgi:HAD superfamily hydrolase (TIGR01509 family)
VLRAIIFDFNGIIVDDEPLHFRSMRDAVAPLDISISMEEYWTRYLPLDNKDCLRAICKDYRLELSESKRAEILQEISRLYHVMLEDTCPLFAGAAKLIHAAAVRYPLAIASGALRDDIKKILKTSNLESSFKVVVGAEDFILGKPNPESYLLALERLNQKLNGHGPAIEPRQALVIEDSIAGVRGARAANMICLAVSNSYPAERLVDAHRVVSSLEEVDLDELENLFRDRP